MVFDPARLKDASQGGYFKKEQISWYWEFLTKVIGLSSEKLYISVFEGYDNISRDSESEKIWTEILEKEGLNPKDRIYFYGVDKNWWSRAGLPADMPKGEPGGPDSEVFYDFGTPHDKKFGEKCHPNCQCGRFLEIGNSVFMEYIKKEDGTFGRLPNNNVDFGGGLERLLAAVENQADIFQTSLFSPIVSAIEKTAGKSYKDENKKSGIIIDHLIGSVYFKLKRQAFEQREEVYSKKIIRRAFDNFKIRRKRYTHLLFIKLLNNIVRLILLWKSFEEIKYNSGRRKRL